MKSPGRVALMRFPFTDLQGAKLRPVLLVCRAPGRHDDWLVCMVSSRLHQAEPGFDEVIGQDDDDFAASGLKAPSVVRLGRLAVADGARLTGALGEIGAERLARVRYRLAAWIAGGP